MDHVRLPIDYNVLEDDSRPFHYKEEGFCYIDQCMQWCEKNNLNIILDLHRTAGYAFHTLECNLLFENEVLQDRFISLWKAFALRYKEYGKNVVFELLNEIVEPSSERWNQLSRRTVQAIREIDENRVIIIGGNHYNSVNTLKELDYMNDDNLVYTFHFYEPHLFTHQKASWEQAMQELDYAVSYPSTMEDYRRYQKMSEGFRSSYAFEDRLGKDYIRKCLAPALEFIRERNVYLYCGEYGTIQFAPMESRLRWHEDVSDLMIEYGIGRAVWNYKLMGFPMVDRNSDMVDEDLIKIVSRK
jgi:hypothetical protein